MTRRGTNSAATGGAALYAGRRHARLVIAVPGFANFVTMPARMQEVRRDAIMALEKNRGAVV